MVPKNLLLQHEIVNQLLELFDADAPLNDLVNHIDRTIGAAEKKRDDAAFKIKTLKSVRLDLMKNATVCKPRGKPVSQQTSINRLRGIEDSDDPKVVNLI